MKKRLAVLGAVALAGCLTLTAAGCAASGRNLASLASNWYYDSGFKRIQPSFTGEENAEKLSYTVSYVAPKESSANYSVDYGTGTYETVFYAKTISKDDLATLTTEEWRSGYEAHLGGANDTMAVYYYYTKLSMPEVTFTYGSSSETFEDSRITESYFLSVEDRLSPLYTKQTIASTAPATDKAASLDKSYVRVNRELETFYNFAGTALKTKITDLENGKTSDYSLSGLGSLANSLFDVSYLDMLARAMGNMSPSLNQAVAIYSAGMDVRDYVLTGSDSALSTDADKAANELAAVQAILEGKGLFTPELIENEDEDADPEYTKLGTVAVRVNYVGSSDFVGFSQYYWFAKGETNVSRTLMLKYSTPLAFGLGTLEYLLNDIKQMPKQ